MIQVLPAASTPCPGFEPENPGAATTLPPPLKHLNSSRPRPTTRPAQALLAAAPVETTAALMGLCLRDPSDPGAWVASMADFTHLYTDR